MKKFLLCALMLIVGCCLFVGCENDEYGGFSKSDFVGKWKHNYSIHQIHTDGSITTQWSIDNSTTYGKWSYNKKQNTFSISYNHNNGATYVFLVQSITYDKITLINMDNSGGISDYPGVSTMTRQ